LSDLLFAIAHGEGRRESGNGLGTALFRLSNDFLKPLRARGGSFAKANARTIRPGRPCVTIELVSPLETKR
jgi:hypothetical protein